MYQTLRNSLGFWQPAQPFPCVTTNPFPPTSRLQPRMIAFTHAWGGPKPVHQLHNAGREHDEIFSTWLVKCNSTILKECISTEAKTMWLICVPSIAWNVHHFHHQHPRLQFATYQTIYSNNMTSISLKAMGSKHTRTVPPALSLLRHT